MPTKAEVFIMSERESLRIIGDMMETRGNHRVVGYALNTMRALKSVSTLKEKGVQVVIVDRLDGGYETSQTVVYEIRKQTPEIKILSISDRGKRVEGVDENLDESATDFATLPERTSMLSALIANL